MTCSLWPHRVGVDAPRPQLVANAVGHRKVLGALRRDPLVELLVRVRVEKLDARALRTRMWRGRRRRRVWRWRLVGRLPPAAAARTRRTWWRHRRWVPIAAAATAAATIAGITVATASWPGVAAAGTTVAARAAVATRTAVAARAPARAAVAVIWTAAIGTAAAVAVPVVRSHRRRWAVVGVVRRWRGVAWRWRPVVWRVVRRRRIGVWRRPPVRWRATVCWRLPIMRRRRRRRATWRSTTPRRERRPRVVRLDALGAQLITDAVRSHKVLGALCGYPVVEQPVDDLTWSVSVKGLHMPPRAAMIRWPRRVRLYALGSQLLSDAVCGRIVLGALRRDPLVESGLVVSGALRRLGERGCVLGLGDRHNICVGRCGVRRG